MKRGAKKKLIDFFLKLTNFFTWVGVGLMIFRVSPEHWYLVVSLLLLVFASLFFSFVFLFKNYLIASLGSAYLVILLVLSLFRQAHWLNIILLTAFVIAIWVYLKRQLDNY